MYWSLREAAAGTPSARRPSGTVSAGSGKSNTIAWLAHRLSRLHTPGDPARLGAGTKAAGLSTNEPVFDKVIIVTDRVVLDRQLQDTVASFDHTPGVIVKIDQDSAQLRAALEGKQARVIITTLQKFPFVAQAATNLSGTRFAVVVDEAHSSQSGEAAKDLKAVLSGKTGDAALTAAEAAEGGPAVKDAEDLLAESLAARGKQDNVTFLAFTATPKHKTLSLFGERTIPAQTSLRCRCPQMPTVCRCREVDPDLGPPSLLLHCRKFLDVVRAARGSRSRR
jgi:type I restriction enzyme R subunit